MADDSTLNEQFIEALKTHEKKAPLPKASTSKARFPSGPPSKGNLTIASRPPETLTLPWPPSVNSMYRSVNGRTILSKPGRAYKEHAALILNTQPFDFFGGRVSVSIEAYPPNRRLFDLDNRLKAVLDSLEDAGVYDDDEQIDDLRIVRMPVAKDSARVEVTIAALDNEGAA